MTSKSQKDYRRMKGRLLWVGLYLLCCAEGKSVPADQMNTVGSLRRAIEFLADTYKGDYPNGAGYLKRLGTITDATSSEYKQLQREALLNHPHIKGYPWLVEVRNQYWGNHGPINTMFQNGDINQGGRGGLASWHSHGGRLEVLTVGDDGSVSCARVLAEEPDGILRDADVSFDGQKILYSMRKNKADDYHLYEMELASGSVKQLTFGSMLSDVDPVYMPDGRIVFSSTRDPKYCQCNRHIQLNLFSMAADGANIVQISRNNLADFHSSLMSDGRLLYSRWEYVDRHFGPSLGLWTTNPDGTRHALYMGNNGWSPGSMVDARVVPGTDQVVCIYGATHDLPWGALAVVDRSKGLEGTAPVLQMWPDSGRARITADGDPQNYSTDHKKSYDNFRNMKARYEDPYPVHDLANGDGGGSFFLVSKALSGPMNSYSNRDLSPVNMAVVLVDVFGNEVVVYDTNETMVSPYGLLPLAARKRPPSIPDSVDFSKDHGFLYVNDVYLGTDDEMSAVKKGAIKYLRLIEAPAKRAYDDRGYWSIDAAQIGIMNWNLTNNKRILGDVPVESDGSAYFQVPADTFLQMHALDENKQMIQAMRSGTMVRPGETQGCIGCHENRLTAPAATNPMPKAMKRAPSQLAPWLDTPNGVAKPFNYLTEVQPVFDTHCVSCHDYGKPAGETLNLSGDLSQPFNVSYMELMSKSGERYTGPEEKLVNFVGDGPPGVLPAYAWGSHHSKLVRVLHEGHHNVKLSDEEMQRIISWIDVNAVYYGSYTSYYPGRNPLLALPDGNRKNKVVLGQWAKFPTFKNYVVEKGHLVNFTRPEKSPVLAMIKDETVRKEALSYLREASALVSKIQREDQTQSDVAQSENDQHDARRTCIMRAENQKSIDAVRKGSTYYPFK